MAPDGRFLHADGPALDVIDQTIVGKHYEVVTAAHPEVGAVLARTLNGRRFSGTLEFGGYQWHVEAHPVYMDGALIGVSGASTLIEDDQRDSEPDVDRELEIAGDMPHLEMWSGDRFLVKDGRRWVTQVRVRPLDDLATACVEAPERVHVIRERSAPAPRLQVVR